MLFYKKLITLRQKQKLMDFDIIAPSPQIAEYVSHYWHFSTHTCHHNVQEVMPTDFFLPSGCVYIIFNRQHHTIYSLDDDNYFPRAFIFGQKTIPTAYSIFDEIDVVCVVLQTFAAGLLFKIPIIELFNRAVDINDIDDTEMKEMAQRVCYAPDIKASIFAFENFVERRLAVADFYHIPRLSSAIRSIYMNPAIRMRDVSDIACLSERQLLRIFDSTIGLSPKQFERIAKLKRMFYILNNNREQSLVRMAIQAGYYDQAHMNHEFMKMTSFSPNTFFNNLDNHEQLYVEYLKTSINIGKRLILGEKEYKK